MPRRKNVIRPSEFHATIPSTEKARLDLALFSPLEGKIPFGSYQAFLLDAIRLRYEWVGLDLGELLPHLFPLGTQVRGPRTVIDSLQTLIEKGQL